MAVANCPSCGGPIEFKIGSSVVVICDHCHSIVARTDRGYEDLGKVAALVDTGSPLRRDLPGKIRGNGFRITGRTQMKHPMGGVWDEWYAAFDNGQWGWIAEAQGKYYLTVKTERHDLPPYDILQIGGSFDGMKVVELATATTISGEGEIPFRVEPGSTYPYADLSGANRRFGTIDYSEDPPLLFEGEETTLADLGINIELEAGRTTKVRVTALSCTQCGGPLNLVAPDQAERIICPHCGAAHDVNAGNLQYLKTLKRHGPQPVIPLGAKGKIGTEEYVVAGYMQRSVTFDKKYYWTEYLLFATRTKSFAWLVDDDGHWSFVVPMSAGDVKDSDPAGAAVYIRDEEKTYHIFQDSVATVESVIGEFYWRVEKGEQARAVDYIAPPDGITKEFSDTESSHEVNYSKARYMPQDEVESAFGVSGLPRPRKLGTLQPLPPKRGGFGKIWAALVVAFIVVSLIVTTALPHREVLSETYRLDEVAPATGADWSQGTTTATTTGSQSAPETSAVIITKPFEIKGGHNLKVAVSTRLSEAWMHVDGNLFNEASGFVEPFSMQLEHYEGVEDGEHWSEGSLSGSKYFSTLAPGTYAIRMETLRDANKPPPALKVTVTEGVYSPTGCGTLVLALILLTIPAIISKASSGVSESDRWADAMFTPSGRLNE